MATSIDAMRTLTCEHVIEIAFPALPRATAHLLDLCVHTIPQQGEPRWIVLGDVKQALPVLQSWRPWNLSSRVRWSAVLAAASSGMLAYLPGVAKSRATVDLAYWWRSEIFDFVDVHACSIVIHVGSRSHTRKAIVFLVAEKKIRFVARVPLVEAAGEAILNEVAVLRALAAREFLPRVLFADAQRGVAAQSWLEGKPVARGLTAAHLDLLAKLARPGRTVRLCDFEQKIAAEVGRLRGPFETSVLHRALALLRCNEPLPCFVEHRDFAPWNLKWLASGCLGLLDWEWSVLDGLPWQDVCRFFYVEDAHFDGPGNVWEQMSANPLLRQHCERFAIPQRVLPPLTMHYLLRVLVMDWRSGNASLAQHSYVQILRLLQVIRHERRS